MLEQILTDFHVADPEWNVVLLRYFNPIGAHESGMIGEDPKGIPNNLVPYIAQVAVGKLPCLGVFGNDYPTHDGTGVREALEQEKIRYRKKKRPKGRESILVRRRDEAQARKLVQLQINHLWREKMRKC